MRYHQHARFDVEVLLCYERERSMNFKALLRATHPGNEGTVYEAWGNSPKEAIAAAFAAIEQQ